MPDGIYALMERAGEVVSYKARWRGRDISGVQRQRSKSFSRRDAGSLDRARAAAVAHRAGAVEIVRSGDSVLRADRVTTRPHSHGPIHERAPIASSARR